MTTFPGAVSRVRFHAKFGQHLIHLAGGTAANHDPDLNRRLDIFRLKLDFSGFVKMKLDTRLTVCRDRSPDRNEFFGFYIQHHQLLKKGSKDDS